MQKRLSGSPSGDPLGTPKIASLASICFLRPVYVCQSTRTRRRPARGFHFTSVGPPLAASKVVISLNTSLKNENFAQCALSSQNRSQNPPRNLARVAQKRSKSDPETLKKPPNASTKMTLEKRRPARATGRRGQPPRAARRCSVIYIYMCV